MKLRISLLLLGTPIAAALAVPFYNRATPTLDGWPFFFWWQTACVIAGAVFTGAAYLLDEREARRQEAQRACDCKGKRA